MTGPRWVVLAPLLTMATVLAAVALGPPERSAAAWVGADQIGSWCRAQFGPGQAVYVRDAWQCSHEQGGFFLLSPVAVPAVCANAFPGTRPSSANEDGIRCA